MNEDAHPGAVALSAAQRVDAVCLRFEAALTAGEQPRIEDFLGPTPGLIVHGVEDAYCSPDGAREAYERMTEPKRLVWLDARLHIDLYDTEPHVTQAVEAVTAFLAEHL